MLRYLYYVGATGKVINLFSIDSLINVVVWLIHYLMITRLSYLRDNSVISFESSYRQGGLRPRCWIKIYLGVGA